jgi:hypothetical protein
MAQDRLEFPLLIDRAAIAVAQLQLQRRLQPKTINRLSVFEDEPANQLFVFKKCSIRMQRLQAKDRAEVPWCEAQAVGQPWLK